MNGHEQNRRLRPLNPPGKLSHDRPRRHCGSRPCQPKQMVQLGQSAALGFSTGFTLAAASMVINDYYDRQIDAINEPNRPIPSGLIKPNYALWFASILTVVGFVTSYLTNIFCLATA